MQLVIYCKDCFSRNKLKIRGTYRYEIEQKYGKSVELECKKCKTKKRYPISEVKAEVGYSRVAILIFTGVLFFIAFYILWEYNWRQSGSVYLLPTGLLIIALIYGAFITEMEKKIKLFNRS